VCVAVNNDAGHAGGSARGAAAISVQLVLVRRDVRTSCVPLCRRPPTMKSLAPKVSLSSACLHQFASRIVLCVRTHIPTYGAVYDMTARSATAQNALSVAVGANSVCHFNLLLTLFLHTEQEPV
jgi:hypothetical protein